MRLGSIRRGGFGLDFGLPSLALVLAVASCAKAPLTLRDRPCSNGACSAGLVCHPEIDRCVPTTVASCVGLGVCPESVATGDACAATGSFIPCDSRATACEVGCRTCAANLTWSSCTPGACRLGDVRHCATCADDCGAIVRNAKPTCITRDGVFACAYEGACAQGAVDLDGVAGNGCECVTSVSGVEICDGLDNNCDGTVDEGASCGAGARCLQGACAPCGATDPTACGEGCIVCAGTTPACVAGVCECTPGSCAATTPLCTGGACLCAGDSCGAPELCLPSGACAAFSNSSHLVANPRRLDADGASSATLTVTLIDDATAAPLAGRVVLLASSRGASDLITQPGLTNVAGMTVGSVRSAVAGVAVFTAVAVAEALVIAEQPRLAFVPLAGLTARYPLDAPNGRVLALGDLGGVANGNLRALWHLDEAGGHTLADSAGGNDIPIGLRDEFTAGFSGSLFVPVGVVATSGAVDLTAPVDVSDSGGNARVTANAGAVDLHVTSTGVGLSGAFNAAYVRQTSDLATLAGDFDIQIDAAFATVVAGGTAEHVIAGLEARFAAATDSAYVRVEYYLLGGFRYVRGVAKLDAQAEARSGGVYVPALVGKLRLSRVGTTVNMYHWDGAAWVWLYQLTGASATAPSSIVAGASTNLGEAQTIDATVDNFRTGFAPARTPAGKLARALGFNGLDEVVQLNTASITLTNSITIEAFFRSPGGGLGNPRLFEGSTDGSNNSHTIVYGVDGTLNGRLDCAGANNRFVNLVTGATKYADDAWHHVALTYSGATANLYVDASVQASTAAVCALLDPVVFLTLGGLANLHTNVFKGLLDEVAVFDVDLSAAQVTNHYRRGRIDDVVGANSGNLVGPVSVGGALGEALLFDGIDDYAEVPVAAANAFTTGDFSVTLWLMSSASPRVGIEPVVIDKTTLAAGYRLALDGNAQNHAFFEVRSGGVAERVQSFSVVNDGLWHHLAAVKTATTLCLYVDAALSGCTAHTRGNLGSIAPLRLGSASAGSFAGALDEVKLYGRALSAADIAADASRP